MAVTCAVTVHPRFNCNYKLDNWRATGFKLVAGWMAMPASGTSSSGGNYGTITALGSVVGCFIQPASGYSFLYDHSTDCIKTIGVIATSTAEMNQVASSVDLSGYASVPFLAWGF